MSPLAFYRELLANGVPEATAYEMAAKFEAEREHEVAARYEAMVVALARAPDPKAEARKAKDRERKRAEKDGIPRNSTESTEFHEAPPLPLPSSPQTPQQPTPTPPDITTRARGPVCAKPNGFARWWEAYPNKVGKRAAEQAYAKALKRVSGLDPPGQLLAGVERATVSRKWREGIIPNPATWLNQDRWEDQPAEITPLQAKPHDRPHHDAKFDARQDNLRRAFAGAEAAARRPEWEP